MEKIEMESTKLLHKYKIIASDNKTDFIIDDRILNQCAVLKEMIEALANDSEEILTIPLPQTSAQTLAAIIKFCKHHQDSPPYSPPSGPTACFTTPSKWDITFLKSYSSAQLMDIIHGANYLHIPRLVDAACFRLQLMVEKRNVPEIRRIFQVDGDFTPAEEQQMLNEPLW